jgi:hypothetical protein
LSFPYASSPWPRSPLIMGNANDPLVAAPSSLLDEFSLMRGYVYYKWLFCISRSV